MEVAQPRTSKKRFFWLYILGIVVAGVGTGLWFLPIDIPAGLLWVWLTLGLFHGVGQGRMLIMSKLYSEQFKADAVALVESGISRRQVCADLGISRSSLQKNRSLTLVYKLMG